MNSSLKILLILFTILCCTTISSANIQESQEGVILKKRCSHEREISFFTELVAPNTGTLHGTGNAPGIFEIGARAKSTARVRQQLSDGNLREFVYLPDQGVFAINKKLFYRNGGSPHETIRASLPNANKVVGGNISFKDGKYFSDEISGHYGRNWTPEIRVKFEEFLKGQGFEVIHSAF